MISIPGQVWDTSSLLNLVATGRAEEILRVFGCPAYIERVVYRGDGVRRGEVLDTARTSKPRYASFTKRRDFQMRSVYLRPLPEENRPGEQIPVDLSPLFASGMLTETELDEAERALFVAYAAEIDDGEARSAAVAVHRGLWLMTDDRPCVNLMASLPVPPIVMTTPDWVKEWVDHAGISLEALAETLRRIHHCANYHARRNHPLRDWWNSHLRT